MLSAKSWKELRFFTSTRQAKTTYDNSTALTPSHPTIMREHGSIQLHATRANPISSHNRRGVGSLGLFVVRKRYILWNHTIALFCFFTRLIRDKACPIHVCGPQGICPPIPLAAGTLLPWAFTAKMYSVRRSRARRFLVFFLHS